MSGFRRLACSCLGWRCCIFCHSARRRREAMWTIVDRRQRSRWQNRQCYQPEYGHASLRHHAARFRFAPSRSRAAPYTRKKEKSSVRASTTDDFSFFLVHGLSLGCKFRPVPLDEEEQDDDGDYDGDVEPYPFGEFGTLSGVGFFQEIFPAPAVTCSTEEYVHKASQRKQVVADDEVFQVQDGRALSERCEAAEHVITEHAGHGKDDNRDQVNHDSLSS